MATPILDFSHLTPEERIELAEQLGIVWIRRTSRPPQTKWPSFDGDERT